MVEVHGFCPTDPIGMGGHPLHFEQGIVRRLPKIFLVLFTLLCGMQSAAAIESVRVPLDARAIDLTLAVERYSAQGDRLQVSTAPGSDGIVRRIEVSARETGTQPAWIVFALTNDTDEQLERLIVAPHFRLVGSGVIWPDLGASRVSAITASQGFPPEREESADADVFRLTLDPGTTVTYVAELRTPNLPQVYLWEPDAYKDKVTSLTLYKGLIIGISGLLALFLTIVFVVKGAVIFPAAAALAWAVLAYVCIDFGFWNKLFDIGSDADRIWRAGAETILAATLLVFLFAYLNLSRWHVRASHVAAVWLIFLAALVGLAVYDAPVAAGVARISLATIAAVGFILVLYLSTHGYDRAVMLIPTWFLLLVWVAAAGFTVTGTLTNDLVSPALIGGLVLIVMLIGFTVMQNAFAGGGLAHGLVSDSERRALALTGAGDIIFDWDVASDRIYVSPEAEQHLGVKRGVLEGPASAWLDILHAFDRDRYTACLDTVLEQRRGRVSLDFRLRAADGHYVWFLLKARPVVGADGEVVRVIGTLSDVTESKTAEERLLHDAVHDNLTGLPNRELFFGRLDGALANARVDSHLHPTVICIDLDRFRQINDAVGLSAGDSILLTVSRRLSRLIKEQDLLSRTTSDQFAIILLSEMRHDQIVALADKIRRTISTPVSFGDREVALTGSIGIALYDAQLHPKRDDMLKDAEIAMAHAKKLGGNRTEVFRPGMRSQRSDRLSLEADLRRALDRGEMKVFFQPVVRLEDRTIAGFETLLRWDHPRLGRLNPTDFVPIAEETGVIVDLGIFALERAARELSAWQHALDVDPPIFCSVNISSRQLLRHDLLHDVKSVLTRSSVIRGTLKLEVAEALVMENPEYAAQMLERIHDLGAGLSLDDFGAGSSSLSYLQRFPFDTIKIDKSFVKQNGKGSRPVILRSIIGLAHDLGIEVIAEGAETESDAIELSQMGCEFAQGYAFGHPITAIEARRLVGAATEAA
jgi:diguanylate cyclase (GGDEF)-like protein/PAS domain S-box-containing protein